MILDTSGPPLHQGMEGGVYLIKPNIRELSELAGSELMEDAEIREVARSLISSGKVHVVVTSLGSAGVVVITGEHCQNIRAPTVKVQSKVGARDSTVAGIVWGLAQEKVAVTENVDHEYKTLESRHSRYGRRDHAD